MWRGSLKNCMILHDCLLKGLIVMQFQIPLMMMGISMLYCIIWILRICTCRQNEAQPGFLSISDKEHWLSYLFDAALFLPGLKELRERGRSGMCRLDR